VIKVMDLYVVRFRLRGEGEVYPFEYPLFGYNITVSSNQAIRIYAAASAGNVSAGKEIVLINHNFLLKN
jgi:hypothetical protein